MKADKTKKMVMRVVSSLTLCFFLFSQATFANPGAGIEMAVQRELPSHLSMDVPAELGTVDALYEAPAGANPQFILHIQNAHANYQAQMKIKELLGYMNKKYGFKTIFVEGASEKLDADYLRLFPDQERNVKLCDELAKQGELTGAELFLMEQPAAKGAVEALGIEQAPLYKANYEALKKVFGAETDVTHFFKGFDGKLDKAASRTFTPETRELIADWKRFEQGRRDFLPFVKGLVAKSKKIMKVDLESLFAQVGWPQITRLLVIQQMEKDLDKAKGIEEQAALVTMLRTKGVSKELLATLENFSEGSIAVGKSSHEVSPREVLERLASEAGPKGFKFSDYPAFSLYAGYVTLRSELDSKVLFEEIEYLFTQMLDTLAQEPQQKALLALYRDGELLRKLLHLELNRAQWHQLLEAKDRIAIPSLVARLKERMRTEYGATKEKDVVRRTPSAVPVMPPAFAKTMNELFNAGLEFYSYAHQRETVFYKEMQIAMTERKITKAILITGGFHTDGMSDLFRDNAISYGIVTPRLSEKSDENLYQKVMLQNREYPFSVSYLEQAIKAGPITNQPNPAVAVAMLLDGVMNVDRSELREAVGIMNDSRFARRNNIGLIETGNKDSQGRAEVRIISRVETPVATETMGPIASGPTDVEGYIEADRSGHDAVDTFIRRYVNLVLNAEVVSPADLNGFVPYYTPGEQMNANPNRDVLELTYQRMIGELASIESKWSAQKTYSENFAAGAWTKPRELGSRSEVRTPFARITKAIFFAAVMFMLMLPASVRAQLSFETQRFAPNYTTQMLTSDPFARERFINDVMKAEGQFIQPGVGVDAQTGMTVDGIGINYRTGQLEGIQRVWTAASKESLHVTILARAVAGDKRAQIMVSPNDPTQAKDKALDILGRKLKSLRQFNKDYPGYGGFLPWVVIKNGQVQPTAYPSNPDWDWTERTPGLDNGQLVWAYYALIGALEQQGQKDLALGYRELFDTMVKNSAMIFYNGDGRIRAEAGIRDNKAQPTAGNYYDFPKVKRGEAYYLDDPYEGELFRLFMVLFSPDLSAAEKDRILKNSRAKLKSVEFETPQGSVTVGVGHWFSGHEPWKFLGAPFVDVPVARTIFLNGETARTWNSAMNKIAGLFASVGLPVPEGRNVPYQDGIGIASISRQPIKRTDVVTPYAAAPVILATEFLSKFSVSGSSGVGLAWYRTMLMGPRMQGPYGSTEAVMTNGSMIAPLMTWDSKILPPVAMMGGGVDLAREMLKRDGLYETFYRIVDEEYRAAFPEIRGTNISPALPTAELPTGVLGQFSPAAVPGTVNMFAKFSADSKWEGAGNLQEEHSFRNPGELTLPKTGGFIFTGIDHVDLRQRPVFIFRVKTRGEGLLGVELKNTSDQLITDGKTFVRVPNSGGQWQTVAIDVSKQGVTNANGVTGLLVFSDPEVEMVIDNPHIAERPESGSLELGWDGSQFVQGAVAPSKEQATARIDVSREGYNQASRNVASMIRFTRAYLEQKHHVRVADDNWVNGFAPWYSAPKAPGRPFGDYEGEISMKLDGWIRDGSLARIGKEGMAASQKAQEPVRAAETPAPVVSKPYTPPVSTPAPVVEKAPSASLQPGVIVPDQEILMRRRWAQENIEKMDISVASDGWITIDYALKGPWAGTKVPVDIKAGDTLIVEIEGKGRLEIKPNDTDQRNLGKGKHKIAAPNEILSVTIGLVDGKAPESGTFRIRLTQSRSEARVSALRSTVAALALVFNLNNPALLVTSVSLVGLAGCGNLFSRATGPSYDVRQNPLWDSTLARVEASAATNGLMSAHPYSPAMTRADIEAETERILRDDDLENINNRLASMEKYYPAMAIVREVADESEYRLETQLDIVAWTNTYYRVLTEEVGNDAQKARARLKELMVGTRETKEKFEVRQVKQVAVPGPEAFHTALPKVLGAGQAIEARGNLLRRQELAKAVWDILPSTVCERLQSTGFNAGDSSLVDVLGLIVIPADLGNITPEQVAGMLTKLVVLKTGELDWEKFSAAVKAILANPIMAVSDASGATVIVLNEAPTQEELEDQILQLGMNTGHVVRYVVPSESVDTAQQRAILDTMKSVQGAFDLKGNRIGDRIKIDFSRKVVNTAQSTALALGHQNEAFQGGAHMTILVAEGMSKDFELATGTVIESQKDNKAHAAVRNLLAMKAAQMGVAVGNMGAMALLNKQVGDDVIQRLQNHFGIDGDKLGALAKLWSDMVTARATAIAA